jgi:organic hydroperoxide reductase OsmC/OhrA
MYMTSIHHPMIKDGKHFVFDIRLDWLNEQKGVLTANDTNGPIYVATPPAFGGQEKEWSPEHLFLGSIASCFMSTYIYFARKMKFTFAHIECHAIGQIELVEGKYKFTHIGVFPTIRVSDATVMELADLAILKAQKSCLISNTINAEIVYQGKVVRMQ